MTTPDRGIARVAPRTIVAALAAGLAGSILHAQTQNSPPTSTPAVPSWAQPGSATRTQVAPPADFHRPSTTFNAPIGIFDGQSDIGSAVVPGSATYDPGTQKYTINSAGYNVW